MFLFCFVEQFVQLFAGLKMRNIAGVDAQLFAGAGVFGHTRRAGANRESAETAELDTLAVGQGIDDAVQNNGHDPVNFLNRQTGVFRCNFSINSDLVTLIPLLFMF